jgi:hypothetical protein
LFNDKNVSNSLLQISTSSAPPPTRSLFPPRRISRMESQSLSDSSIDEDETNTEVMLTNGQTGVSGTNEENRSSRLSRFAEEETALNRAILLSLQGTNVITSSMSVPSEDNIQLLLSMGFEREQSVLALQNCGNDVGHATDRLLNG